MFESPNFTLFPMLLPEIRLQIWEHALQPRIISFSSSLYSFDVRNAPQALYLVGGDAPYSHFTMDVPERPPSPYYLVQCYPLHVASPPLLGTCHESRDVALRYGYKTWRIENESLGTRHVMWNPKLDIISISLAEVHRSQSVDELCLDIFISLFPEQIREIRRLVVESEHYPPYSGLRHACEWTRILRFPELVELVVLVEPYTRRTVGMSFDGGADGGLIKTIEKKSKIQLQIAADSVRSCLALAKERRMRRIETGCEEYMRLDRWFPERIRVVGYESHVLDEE
ncbi:hypothetical protein N431DRAFT_477670 [Stipitochalara longipes BDJ]|nr:hypothetical protein N431DRAFT_477670 [Stipitochalara longipes BDJ]